MIPLVMTVAELRACAHDLSASRAAEVITPLARCFELAEITTAQRAACLLSQLLHECGEFRYNQEGASGAAYEGREDLGNVRPGDGKRYKGRGWIQLTGRANYKAFSIWSGVDVLAFPERATSDALAAEIAAWYWMTRRCNHYADQKRLRKITKLINGAATDEYPSFYLRREAYYFATLKALGSRPA